MYIDKFSESQKKVYKILKNEYNKKRFSHAYLFEIGNKEDKKAIFSFIADILDLENDIELNVESKINVINPEKGVIKKEQILNLKTNFSIKGLNDKPLIYLINDVEKMNKHAANTILKFLEEPEQNIIAVFITENIEAVLTTIVSRCQNLIFEKQKTDTMNYDFSIEILDIMENRNFLLFLEKYADLYKYTKDEVKKIFEDLIVLKSKKIETDYDSKIINILLTSLEKLEYNINISLFWDDFFIKLEDVNYE